MIELLKVAPGHFLFLILWKQGAGLKITLKLTDIDGDIDEREYTWQAQENMRLYEVIREVAAMIDPIPHWRARAFGGQLRIQPTNPNNDGEVTIEVMEP